MRLPTDRRIMIAGIAVEMPPTMFSSITFQEWPFFTPTMVASAAPMTRAI
jgi:hypothetical protein